MSERRSAVCLGNFDGVHTGHRLLLEQTVHVAKQQGLSPLACWGMGRRCSRCPTSGGCCSRPLG